MRDGWEQLKYSDLLTEFAAGDATPGGGAAGAIAGALGAALVGMVCRLTIGRKKYREVEDKMQDILEQSEELQESLCSLSNQDTQAFNRVMDAYKLPRETWEEKNRRTQRIQGALRRATEVPLELMRQAIRLARLGRDVLQRGNQDAASDAAAAVQLAAAALQIGYYNVTINLADLKDSAYVEKCGAEAEEIAREKANIVDEVEKLFAEQVLG